MFSDRRQPRIVVPGHPIGQPAPPCFAAPTPDGSRRRGRPAANRYFFSGSGAPGCLNGNVLNIDFAWFCICSCICTNMFFDCSM